MAKKTTITVATQVGTFSRTTARTYTHIVVAEAHAAAWLEKIRADRRRSAEQHVALYQAELDGTRPRGLDYSHQDNPPMSDAKVREQQARHQEILDMPDPAGELATRGAMVLGWCGRLDLARKLWDRERGQGIYSNLAIFDIETGNVIRIPGAPAWPAAL